MKFFSRAGGVLLHPSSLPGPYGIGDLGPQAYKFVNWLASTGCKLWQVLPLGPTGYGDSPYQCFSAFAGNPYLISFDLLVEDELLTREDLTEMPNFNESRVDFGQLIPWKLGLLEKAFSRFSALLKQPADQLKHEVREEQTPEGERVRVHVLNKARLLLDGFDDFRAENASWLEDFALFMSLKEAHGGGAWNEWPQALRKREPAAIEKARQDHTEDILRHSFYQFLFFSQWHDLRMFAEAQDITIIGDIPIFIAYDSADAWANPDLFFLGDDSLPTVVAGVPPDYFSRTGQLWGNPLYRWKVHKKTGYAWWIERFRSVLKFVDVVRLDHFRGFAGYYEIPYGAPTAETGQWMSGPGKDFFKTVARELRDAENGSLPIIAEDLGVITPDVVELRESFNLPGMRILQFGFTGPDNPFLPHSYVTNCVAYTGTHDNDTACGWFETAPEDERKFALRYLNSDGRDFAWDLMRGIWSSVAVHAIAPMQDLLSLGTEARMNYPSRLGGNWEWRMKEDDMNNDLAGRLRELNELYLR
jgi:4-alpha-glucanotransferase